MRRAIIGWGIGTFIALVFTFLTCVDAPEWFSEELTNSGFFVIIGFVFGMIGLLWGLATNHVHH